ncbi:MAG TPA: hypothetical protein VH414_22525 [Lichenihabitans sp.]|jgi:hypothetical protein|nr:hypothetical protein [Lichenihabitans sp.]
MGRLLTGLNRKVLRRLGLEIVEASALARDRMLLDHYQAASEAAKAPLHPDLMARVVLLGRLLKPRRLTSHRKIRVGGREDGGYVMIDDLDRLKTAFSLGVGPNVDWDHAMAERGIDVYQFDHTVAGPPRQHPRFHFHKKRIDGIASPETENLVSLLDAHGSPGDRANILKVDIEDSEWSLFANTDPEVLARFPQILCELHSLGYVHDDGHYRRMTEALGRLRDRFEIVHVHGNNCGRRVFVADQAFPHVLEITLANKALYGFGDDAEDYPMDLDAPNDTGRPDYLLGRFDFGDAAGADVERLERLAMSDEAAVGFDRDAYLSANPDVADAGFDPWAHWRLFGRNERRPLAPGESDFDAERYLAANPDVAAAGFDAFAHWHHFGKREGRPLPPPPLAQPNHRTP